MQLGKAWGSEEAVHGLSMAVRRIVSKEVRGCLVLGRSWHDGAIRLVLYVYGSGPAGSSRTYFLTRYRYLATVPISISILTSLFTPASSCSLFRRPPET